MKTITLKGFIHFKHDRWAENHDNDFSFWRYEDLESNGYVKVCPHEFSFEVPEDFNPVPGQIAALEAKRAKVQREFTETINRINAEIGKLQAIEYEPAEAAP